MKYNKNTSNDENKNLNAKVKTKITNRANKTDGINNVNYKVYSVKCKL